MLTRRDFIERIAAAGGVSAAYDALAGLGLLPTPQDTPFNLSGDVKGIRIGIIGAGLAGLTVAYELGKRGYACTVLEARDRPGGRAHTIRRGTGSEEDGPAQTCAFDEGLYFNCGAMRIAHHHTTTLDYCRELNVPLELFAITSDSQFIYQSKAPALNGRRLRLREVRTDVDGYLAELSKSISANALSRELTKDDAERLLEYLKSLGRLDAQSKYRGHELRGPDRPAAADGVDRYTPLPLRELLGSRAAYYITLGYDYQPTMLQIAGGSDRLPQALAARLKGKIIFQAAARQIRQTERGVSIVYANRDGALQKLDADYVVCALPLTMLSQLDTDLPQQYKAAIASAPYSSAGKMGLQFKRRFWEEDDHIFGGFSRTDQDIERIIYPSAGFLGRKGILVGYYAQGPGARALGDKTPAERQAIALTQGARIHPQYAAEFEHGFSVAWHRVLWSKGAWSLPSPEIRRLLIQPDRRVYLAGDHMNLNAWMQGAFESARQVATAIHARVMPERRPPAA